MIPKANFKNVCQFGALNQRPHARESHTYKIITLLW